MQSPLLPVSVPGRAIGGCRQKPAENLYLDAGRERHRRGSVDNGVGHARGQVTPKPVPTVRAPAAGASSHPTTANL